MKNLFIPSSIFFFKEKYGFQVHVWSHRFNKSLATVEDLLLQDLIQFELLLMGGESCFPSQQEGLTHGHHLGWQLIAMDKARRFDILLTLPLPLAICNTVSSYTHF